MQIGPLPFLRRVDAREVLQVLHDLPHSRDAFTRLAHQRRHVVLQEVEPDSVAQAAQLGDELGRFDAGLRSFVGRQHLEQMPEVAFERAEIGADVADRVVDLVRHPGRELTDRGELLRLHELALQALALVHLRLQRRVGIAQLAGSFLHRLFEMIDLRGGPLGQLPLRSQRVGELQNLDVVERFLQDQQPIARVEPRE